MQHFIISSSSAHSTHQAHAAAFSSFVRNNYPGFSHSCDRLQELRRILSFFFHEGPFRRLIPGFLHVTDTLTEHGNKNPKILAKRGDIVAPRVELLVAGTTGT